MITDTEKQRIRATSRGISNKLYNDFVNQRYEGNQDLLDTCLIQPFDIVPEIIDKKLTFFFTLGNYTAEVKEKLVMRNKGNSGKGDDLPWLILHVKFKEKYIKDAVTGELKPLGQRRIKISNINENKTTVESLQSAFNGFNFKYGDKWISYNFTNGKEIRLEHQSSKISAMKLIELSLPFTIEEHRQKGDIADNVFSVTPPKNTPTLDTDGLVGHVFRVTVHQRQGKKVNKLFAAYISNAVSANKY